MRIKVRVGMKVGRGRKCACWGRTTMLCLCVGTMPLSVSVKLCAVELRYCTEYVFDMGELSFTIDNYGKRVRGVEKVRSRWKTGRS